MKVQIQKLENFTDLNMPAYATDLSAGVDLEAALDQDQDLVLQPGERTLVPTGLAIALPPGYEAQIRPRSGLAYKHPVQLTRITVERLRRLLQTLATKPLPLRAACVLPKW